VTGLEERAAHDLVSVLVDLHNYGQMQLLHDRSNQSDVESEV
jgi:hypothetical protein